MKTNAVRLLEEMGVAHELRAYEVDLDDLTAETVADKIGMPPEEVFKTLVARGDRNGIFFAVMPSIVHGDINAAVIAMRRSGGYSAREGSPRVALINTALAC
jgi:Cys-tRNA(Pro)/Cys-tRNA(Cys) deacylase